MSHEVKNSISHRSRAITLLRAYLEQHRDLLLVREGPQ